MPSVRQLAYDIHGRGQNYKNLKKLCGHHFSAKDKKRAADLRRPADSTLKIKVIENFNMYIYNGKKP